MEYWKDPKTGERHYIIPKKELIVGHYYSGECRNTSIARWQGEYFVYIREKFGNRFCEAIYHPEDDNGFDLFLPYKHEFGSEGISLEGMSAPWRPDD